VERHVADAKGLRLAEVTAGETAVGGGLRGASPQKPMWRLSMGKNR
jgi:hypothetical protein